MAVNYIAANGQDLDDVFDPYVTGTSPAATGYLLSSDIDLNTRYAPIVFGSAASATGLLISNGNDLNTLFSAKGTAQYWPSPLPWQRTFSDTTSVIFPNDALALVRLNFLSDGTLQFINNTNVINYGSVIPVGAIPSQFEVMASVISGASPDINDASSFVALSSTRQIYYSLFRNAVGSSQATSTLQITVRRISNPSDSRTANADIVLQAEVIGAP